MLTSGMLTLARQVQALTFDKYCQVIRSTEVSDGAGGTTTTQAVLSNVRCRIAPALLMRDEGIVAGQVQGQTPWRVTVPANTIVSEADELWVADADVRDGDGFLTNARKMEVAAVYGPESRETARVCICSEKG